jgi:hypothetical protein
VGSGSPGHQAIDRKFARVSRTCALLHRWGRIGTVQAGAELAPGNGTPVEDPYRSS